MKFNRRSFGAIAAALMLPFGFHQATAQERETLDLATIVVGYPAGGATDSIARIIADALRGSYADAVVVENRPGAGGRIAAAFVKDQPADGRWLLFTPGFPMIIYPHLYDDMPYDTLTDFAPVAITQTSVMALSIGPGAPDDIETLDDFVDWAKANPDDASFGSPAGGSHHMIGVLFSKSAGIDLEMIAYPGGAPSVVDVLGGHIPAVITPIQEVLPHFRNGDLRTLAIATGERSSLVPDIPTFAEYGYENILIQDWSGFLAPAATPQNVVDHANAAIVEALQSERVLEAMAQLGIEPRIMDVAEFAALVPESWERYRQIIEEIDFSVEQ